MDNAIIRFVFDKNKRATKTRPGLLQIEVRLRSTNKCVYISTGIKIFQNQFSDANGFTCKNHPNSPALTGKGKRIFNQIEAFVLSDKCPSIDYVKNWNQDPSKTESFVEFMKDELRKKKLSYGTLKHHNVLIRKLEEFGKIKTFSHVTYSNVSDFDSFLKKTINTGSTLNKRHSILKHYIKEAINRDLILKDPYTLFKMPSKKGKDPTFLLENEITKIIEYTPTNEKIEKVKDLFLLQCFTGLAYTDLMSFSKDFIFEFEGMKVLRNSRNKTDESFITVLLPEAERIFEKYNYVLPKISNQKYNDYLKLLGTGAGLTKNITTHVGRHTFATYLLNKDIPIETVSRAMGHSNIKMTQHYAKLLGKKVISDMKKLLVNQSL